MSNRKALLGKKLGMSQVWDENGFFVPVTLVDVSTNVVTAVKSEESDGYKAVQLGYGQVAPTKVPTPLAGHFAKAGVEPVRFLREVRVENGEEHKVGEVVTVADFADVEKVDVIGTSKGKGFQGRIKRWGQRRGPMTHGSRFQRHAGSIGPRAPPARAPPGGTSSWSRALARVPRMVSSPSVWPKGPAHLAQRHTKENT